MLEKFDWETICFWMLAPAMMLTIENNRKWVRVLGFLMCFPLVPITIVSAPFVMIIMVIGFFREI